VLANTGFNLHRPTRGRVGEAFLGGGGAGRGGGGKGSRHGGQRRDNSRGYGLTTLLATSYDAISI